MVNTDEESSSFSNSPVSITIDSISTEISSPLREKECRICFEPETDDNPLIYPCLCDGFSKYIHTNCLLKWRLVNLDKPPFFKCMECSSRYNIKFLYPAETFTFAYDAIQATMNGRTSIIYIAFLGSSLFFRTLDRALGSQIIYFLDRSPPQSFKLLLNNDTLYGTLFVFCCLNFLIFLGSHLIFLLSVSLRVYNPFKYFKEMFIPLVLHLAFTANLFIFYEIFKLENSRHTPEIVINFSTSFSFANIALYGQLMRRHNITIRNINSRNIGDVLNRDEN